MTEERNGAAVPSSSASNAAPAGSGHRDLFAAVMESVTQRVASSAKGTGLTGEPLLEAVAEVVGENTREAVALGNDLVPAIKAIIMGVARGTGATNEAALQILSRTARIILHHTADRNGNLAAATKGIVLGAIASARTMGVDTARSATAAAQGALEGASEAGSVTVERVMGALKEPIGGSKVVLPEPLRI